MMLLHGLKLLAQLRDGRLQAMYMGLAVHRRYHHCGMQVCLQVQLGLQTMNRPLPALSM
jgi:hypothetical protein